jgi:serine-type D-Ala-D-Ala carboxypeptidase/endopeptidase (penicillin-binding protein 4)
MTVVRSAALACALALVITGEPARGKPLRSTTAKAEPSRGVRAATRRAKRLAAPKPVRTVAVTRSANRPVKRADPQKLGAHARVAFSRAGELRPTRDPATPRRAEPLTAEEAAAAQIQQLLRGPVLRRGVTGLYVAEARTGAPLFAVNADDPLNPASNVKLISTATALELLGPDFRYPTRVLGPAPEGGVVKGDIYLLGSHDPTLSAADLQDLARAMASAGITAIEGGVVVGSDPTRDGIYRAMIPITITAGEPGQPPTAVAPPGMRLVDIKVTATTSKRAGRPRLTFKTEVVADPRGYPRVTLSIGGTIGRGGATSYPLWTKQRTATAAYALIGALEASSIQISGEVKTGELGDFVGDAVLTGGLPVELGRHLSKPLAEIVARVNKWSINWLADRVVMTAAALASRQSPSMELAIDAMYSWLARHPHIARQDLVIDTGSGLSYRTQITPTDLVSVVRAASGFTDGTTPELASAWTRSLAIAGADGTLRRRFLNSTATRRIVGKTGTLSTVIALSGILEVDPDRPLAFALITNADAPLAKVFVRRAHEQVVGELCKYLATTAAPSPTLPVAPPAPPAGGHDIDQAADLDLGEDARSAEDALDAETATSK